MVWAVDSRLCGNAGVGCGSDGDGGDVRPFDFVAGQHNLCAWSLGGCVDPPLRQDGRRGRRIGGSWGVTVASVGVNGDGRAGYFRGNDGLGFLGFAIGGGFWIPASAGMTGVGGRVLGGGCAMVWAVDSRLRGMTEWGYGSDGVVAQEAG